MIPNLSRRIAVAVSVAALAFAVAPAALAARSKSTQNEAKWVSYDPETKTVVVEIEDRGKGPNTKMVRRGDKVTFNVIPTGSILKRTSVTVNGQKADLTDIQEGKSVLIYWVPDPNKEGELFARKIDVIISEEEFDRRYGTE